MRLLDATAIGGTRTRPRTRSVGVVLVASALAMTPMLAPDDLQTCTTGRGVGIPAGGALVLLTLLAGTAMLLRVPRSSAVAPAMATGAAISTLGGATSGWTWIVSQPCVGNALDRELVTLLLVTAGAAAALATSGWVLYSCDEFEPWYGTRGVVVAAGAAVAVLVCGTGFAALTRDAGEPSVVAVLVALVVPWSIAVSLTGWLRRSPAIAVVVPAAVQVAWLVAR